MGYQKESDPSTTNKQTSVIMKILALAILFFLAVFGTENWECDVCGFFNTNFAPICCSPHCVDNNTRPEEVGNRIYVPYVSEELWNCNVCTFVNIHSATICEICEAKKSENRLINDENGRSVCEDFKRKAKEFFDKFPKCKGNQDHPAFHSLKKE